MLGLVIKGVPFEIANDLSELDRLIWTIAIGEIEGGDFDYRRMEWKKPREIGD